MKTISSGHTMADYASASLSLSASRLRFRSVHCNTTLTRQPSLCKTTQVDNQPHGLPALTLFFADFEARLFKISSCSRNWQPAMNRLLSDPWEYIDVTTHAHTHAHTRMHAHTRTHTHARTHTHTHTNIQTPRSHDVNVTALPNFHRSHDHGPGTPYCSS